MKRNKSKFKRKLLFYNIFLISSFFVSIKIFNKNNITFNNENYLRYVLSSSNPYIEVKNKDLTYYLVNSIINFDLKSTRLFKNTGIEENASDEEIEVAKSEYINDPYPNKKIDEPIVYIYNTHQLEEYSNENVSEFNITPNVMMASFILREKLYNMGINAVVEDGDVTKIRDINNWNYAGSYKATRILMEEAVIKYPTLTYFIDIHRDSVSKKVSTVEIEDKKYAKILFIVGLENENYQDNLKLTETLNDLFNSKYNGLSRGIYKKEGKGVNGVYNQDFHKNTILIEIGGEENTIDEVLNTINAISDVLGNYINGEINES